MRPSSTVSPPVTAMRHEFSAAVMSLVSAPPPAAVAAPAAPGAAAESALGAVIAVAESARAESARAPASFPDEHPASTAVKPPQASATANRPYMEHLEVNVVI